MYRVDIFLIASLPKKHQKNEFLPFLRRGLGGGQYWGVGFLQIFTKLYKKNF
ncbi:MAG: hypothetical protein RL757_1907 [Bacteroidota bacterium]